MYCKCHDRMTLREALGALVGETIEFIAKPSIDELSDIAYTVNRLVGTVSGREIVRLLPASTHEAKIALRMQDYGCIRSRRHRICSTERSQ